MSLRAQFQRYYHLKHKKPSCIQYKPHAMAAYCYAPPPPSCTRLSCLSDDDDVDDVDDVADVDADYVCYGPCVGPAEAADAADAVEAAEAAEAAGATEADCNGLGQADKGFGQADKGPKQANEGFSHREPPKTSTSTTTAWTSWPGPTKPTSASAGP